MFVLFERLFQGYLPVSELPRDAYELNELETVLVGRRSGRAYKLADLVPVRVMAVDEARGRVDLMPADRDDEGDRDGGPPDAARTHGPRNRTSGTVRPSSGRNRPSQTRGRR